MYPLRGVRIRDLVREVARYEYQVRGMSGYRVLVREVTRWGGVTG